MTVELDGCSKEVKLAVMHILGGNKTGALEYTRECTPINHKYHVYIYIII